MPVVYSYSVLEYSAATDVLLMLLEGTQWMQRHARNKWLNDKGHSPSWDEAENAACAPFRARGASGSRKHFRAPRDRLSGDGTHETK